MRHAVLMAAAALLTSSCSSGGPSSTNNEPPLGSIAYSTNAPFTLPVGFTKPAFITFIRDVNGNAVTAPVAWTTDNGSRCTVDQRGYITGTGVGRCNITVTATLNGSSVSATHFTDILAATVPTSAVYRNHVEFGRPTTAMPEDDINISKPQYQLSYNATRGGPNWVAWEL